MNAKKILESLREKQQIMDYYFSEQETMILSSNLRVYKNLSVFCLAIVFLYTLTTGAFLREWRITPFHGILLVLLVVHIFVANYINKHRLKNKTLEKVACVAFSLCIFITLICVDTVAAPSIGQTFCSAFLVVAPCIFIMNLSRMLIDQLFFVAVYAFFAFRFKENAIAFHDMYAIWAGFFFGVILYAITMDLRLQVNAEVLRLKYYSEIDELTKIKNRREANTRISFLLDRKEKTSPCALIMMDVDAFKGINDTYGHKVGDQVLMEVAKVLASSFRKSDVVSRFGGDEFMIFVHGFTQEDFLQKKCEDIQQKIRNIMKDTLSVSCSIGICMLLSGHSTMDEMVSLADQALYETKERQKGTYTIKVISTPKPASAGGTAGSKAEAATP